VSDVTIGNGNGTYTVTGGQGGTITVGNGSDTVVVNGGSGQTITVGNGNDSLTVNGATGDKITAGNGNDRVVVSGGSGNTIVAGNGNETVVASAEHNDTITVGNGNDTVYVGANDTVTIGKGSDLVVLPSSTPTLSAPASITVLEDHTIGMGIVAALSSSGFGQEKIYGFAAADQIEVSTSQFANYAAVLAASRQVGQNTVITLDASDTITLENFQLSNLKSNNVIFTNGGSSATVSLTISGLPSDATLSSAADPAGVSYSAATHTWTVAAGALADLTLHAGEVTGATLLVTATDSATGYSVSQSVALTVNPVAPTLTAPASLSVVQGQSVALVIGETPFDSRDVVALRITGVPADATLSAGTHNSDGSWTLTPAQLSGLTLTAGAATTTSLTVTATNTLGITASASDSIALTVTPAVTISVAVNGTAQEGQVLSAVVTGAGTQSLAYQWQSSADGVTWSNIASATGATYQVQETDETDRIRVQVTPAGGSAATSAASAAVLDAAPTVTTPVITGTAQEGQTLTAAASSGQSDNPVTYAWYSSADNYASQIGAGATYQVKEGDEGATIEVKATATNDNGVSISEISAATGPVLDAAPSVTTPNIVGTAQEGQTLTASASAGQSDNPVTYAWYSSADNYTSQIGTGATYQVKEADEGATIEVKATATNDNGVTASATSAATASVIDNASISVAVTVAGGGAVQQGQSLIALATITGDATDLSAPVTYQWQSSSDGGSTWTNVAATSAGSFGGVAGSLYQLTEGDEQKIFRAQASFTDDTGQVISNTSPQTATVADVTPIITVPFSYAADGLSIVKNGTQIYNDTCSQAPPASPTILSNGVPTPISYLTLGGTWTESGGKAIFSSAGAAPNSAVAGGVYDFAELNTNTDPTSNLGLKLNASFTTTAIFDLAAPTSGTYGTELTDGTPTHGVDQLERLIVARVAGNSVVELVQADLTTNTQTVLASHTLTGAELAGNTQIEFQFTHAANAQTVSGSFELIDNGTVTLAQNFTPAATIFTNGVNWTRVDIGAFTNPGVGLNVGPGQAVAAGETLTASAAANDADATISYQWQKSSSAAFTSVTNIGTNSASYVVQSADAGAFIRVVATTSDPDSSQSATATSQVTGSVRLPVANPDVGVVSQDNVAEDLTSPISGNVLTNDSGAISGDQLRVTAVNGSAAGVGSAVTGTYGTLLLNMNGSYSYQLADGQANVDALSFGQIVTDSFTYTATDNFGTPTSSTLNVVINPHNDAPLIVGAGTTATGSVTESPANLPETVHSISGTVAFTDENQLDTHTAGIFVPAPGNYGNMSVTLDTDSTGGATGSATWAYTVSDAALDPLAQGQTATDTFDVLVADPNGGIAQQPITITLTGSNDTPVVQTPDQSLAFTEDSASVFAASGTSSFTDADLTDTHTVSASLQSATLSSGAALPAGLTSTLASALSTALQTDDSQFVPGQYGWNFALNDDAVDFLAQGEVLNLTYQVETQDPFGGVGTQSINVAITGVNEAPVANPDSGAVIEAGVQGNNVPYAGVPTASGNVLSNDTDPDAIDTHSVTAINGNAALVGTPLSGLYGTLTLSADGSYSYTLDPNSAALQQLAPGATATDVWAYTNTDDNGASSSSALTITVTGTLHAPTLSALAPFVADDDAATPLTINASSPQGGTVTVTISGIPAGATLTDHYGSAYTGMSSVTLTADQLPGLTLTAGSAEVGQTVTLAVQAQVTDGVSIADSAVQTLSIPIFAEPPALSVPSLVTANSNGSVALPISATGDADDVISVTISGIPSDASLSDNAGPLTVVNGSVTLTPAQLAGLSLHAGTTPATLTVTATNAEGSGASTSETVLLTVNSGSAYLWGTASYPVQPAAGLHLYAPAMATNPTQGFGGFFVGSTSSNYNPAGPDSVTDSVVTFDPFMLPENGSPAAVETSTIFTFPFRYNIQWPSISGTQAEGIAVYQTQDGSGNSYLNQVFVTRSSATAALSFSAPTQIEGPLTGLTENPVIVSFRNNADGSLNSYSVAWDQFNPTAGTYTVDFQIFNADGTAASPVETPISLTGVTGGVTSLPATQFRAGSGSYALAHPVTNANGTQSVQIAAFALNGTPTGGSPVNINPDLSHYLAGAKNAITLEQNPQTHTLVTSALNYAQYSAATGNEFAVGWNETVTDTNGKHDQVEFAVFKPGTGVVSRTTFQIADGLPQDIKVQVQNDVAVLEYGDNTKTNVVEFSSTGAQLGSLSVATTQAAQNILNYGDGRIGIVYDNLLDASGTSQIVTDVYDFRTSGVSINDSALADGVDKYVAGTKFNDTFVGENGVNNTYAYVGNATTGTGPADSFTGGSGGWNVAIMPDAESNYSISALGGTTTLTNTGDALHAGSLALTNVQAIAYNPATDPSGNPGSLTATGDRLEILGPLPNGGEPITIASGATLELNTADSGTVTFAGATGALQLDHFAGFTGAIAGFTGQDQLDLRDLVYDPNTAAASFVENGNGTSGTLTVASGGTTASVLLYGNYSATDFAVASDGHGGTLVTDPPASQQNVLAPRT
jgi:VCBS repeat-containing protein